MDGAGMERITVYGPESFSLRPDREQAFAWLSCAEGLPCYDAFARSWPEAAALSADLTDPRAAVCREAADDLTVFLTLGPAAERRIDALFARQEYVLASLLNTVCDQLLFQLDRSAAALLGAEAARDGRYIAARLEPGVDYPVSAQRRLFEPLWAALPFVRISQSGVLCPAKSMMYRVRLSAQPCGAETLHDCARCSQTDCPYRSAPMHSN